MSKEKEPLKMSLEEIMKMCMDYLIEKGFVPKEKEE